MDEKEFENWYAMYPRKEHRIAALKAWRKFNPSPTTIAKMTADLDRFRGVAWEHIPHPASYINGQRWNDERPTAQVIPPKPTSSALQQLKEAGQEAASMSPAQRQANRLKFKEILAQLSLKSVPR